MIKYYMEVYMFDPLRDRDLEERNDDLPKPSMKNPVDRKIVYTILGILLIIVFLIILFVGLYFSFVNK